MAVTLRTDEPHHNRELLAELTDGPSVLRIHPTPLTPAGVADVLRHALGESPHEAFADACHRATSGNPLLLRQLLRALQSRSIRPDAAQVGTVTDIGSRAVSQLVLNRLARLPANATAAAQAVAILGDGATLPDVAAVMELPENDTADAVAPLVRAEILRDHYPFGFVHPLVGEAVYRDLPPGEAQLRHERAARILDCGWPVAGARRARWAACCGCSESCAEPTVCPNSGRRSPCSPPAAHASNTPVACTPSPSTAPHTTPRSPCATHTPSPSVARPSTSSGRSPSTWTPQHADRN
jgi:hypothetical protein